MSTTTVHTCQEPGLPNSTVDGSDISANRDHIIDVLTGSAVQQVLYPIAHIHDYLFKMVCNIAEDNLPEEAKAEWKRWAYVLEDVQAAWATLHGEVMAKFWRNDPPALDTIDNMLDELLANSGFCCMARVDEFLKERAAQAIGFCERQIPDFDPAWATMEGADEHHAKLRSEGFWKHD